MTHSGAARVMSAGRMRRVKAERAALRALRAPERLNQGGTVWLVASPLRKQVCEAFFYTSCQEESSVWE